MADKKKEIGANISAWPTIKVKERVKKGQKKGLGGGN